MAYKQSERYAYIEQLIQTQHTRRTLALIGTASMGAVNVPTPVYSLAHVTQLFGETGTLIEAYKAISPLLSAEDNVTLIKTAGAHGFLRLNYNLSRDSIVPEGLIFKSVGANEIYNHIHIQLQEDALVVVHPKELGGHTVRYAYNKYGTAGAFIEAINEDAQIGNVGVYAQVSGVDLDASFQNALYGCNADSFYLLGARADVTPSKNHLYFCLEDTYAILEGMKFEIVVPLGAYFTDMAMGGDAYGEAIYGQSAYHRETDALHPMNNVARSYYAQAVAFAELQFQNRRFTHVVMGCDPLQTNISDAHYYETFHAFYQANLNATVYLDRLHHVSVVVESLYYRHLEMIENGYLAYAVALLQSDIGTSPLNRPISSTLQVHQNVQDTDAFRALGVVLLKESRLHGGAVVPSSVRTLSQSTTLSTYGDVRACQTVICGFMALLDSYIGQHYSELTQHDHLYQEVRYYFELVAALELISIYDVRIYPSEDGSEITIRITLRFHHAVESVQVMGVIGLA